MEERLRKFAKVVESGSFTHAAAEMHISQPALSTALTKLERELGAELLERSRHPLRPTRAGQAAYDYAKGLDVHNINFKQTLSAIANQRPHVAIGMIDSVADALFVHGNCLSQLEKQTQVSLSINNSRYLARSLERGELNAAFIAAPSETLSKLLHKTELGAEPLVAVTHPDRLTDTKRAIQNNFVPDFISYDQHSNTSRLIRTYFSQRGTELTPVFHSTSPQIILHLVLAGRGCAVLPYLDVREHLEKGVLSWVAGPIPRPIIALQQRGRNLPKPLQELLATTKKILQKLQDEASSRIT